jgi:hypothetical protein
MSVITDVSEEPAASIFRAVSVSKFHRFENSKSFVIVIVTKQHWFGQLK